MSTQAPPQTSLYDHVGGQEPIDRLVDAFYHQMDTLEEARELRALHAADLTETARVLKLYLAQWMGGPGDYSAERGHPRLRARHLGVRIGVAERDAWLLCMKRALDETFERPQTRLVILQALAPLADWMRNQDEGRGQDES